MKAGHTTILLWIVLAADAAIISCGSSRAELGKPNDRLVDPEFGVSGGFYSTPFTVAIADKSPGSQIYYTTDCSEPSPANGLLYSQPIVITNTTVLRAVAAKADCAPSKIRGH